jgi:hypothetical protein
MTLQKLIYLVLALVLTAAPAHAKVQFYSSFATTGPAPTECTEASAIVTPLIAQFHAPADWTRNNIPDSATPRAGRGQIVQKNGQIKWGFGTALGANLNLLCIHRRGSCKSRSWRSP